MKVVKSLLLGTAAGFAAVAGAQAADLPSRKAAPAEYVRICDAYGSGFFYIPGTDTCLRVGGYVRAEYGYDQQVNSIFIPAAKPGVAQPVAAFFPSNTLDATGFLGRGRVDLDARTQTAWGTARTYISLRGEQKTGYYADNYSTGVLTGQTGAGAITVENAIVQFAGFTFGRTTSEVFSFLPAFFYGSLFSAGYPGGINLLSYTATFGGGFSATIGIEDRAGMGFSTNPGFIGQGVTAAGAGSALNGQFSTSGGFANTVANGPSTWPALVGNLRFDQAWGAIQVMGGVVQNSAAVTFPAGFTNLSNVVTQTGWSVGAGLKLNLPMIAAGDVLYLTGAYANGMLDEVYSLSTSAPLANNGRQLGGLLRFDRNLMVYADAAKCAVVTSAACYSTEQTTAWSVSGHFTHYWTPTVRTLLMGGYLNVNPGTKTQNSDWQFGGLSKANAYILAGQIVWTPVKDLDIGAELQYTRLNQTLATNPGFAPSAAGASLCGGVAGCVINPSSNSIQARLRVQRQF
jgi:hypothetical protein